MATASLACKIRFVSRCVVWCVNTIYVMLVLPFLHMSTPLTRLCTCEFTFSSRSCSYRFILVTVPTLKPVACPCPFFGDVLASSRLIAMSCPWSTVRVVIFVLFYRVCSTQHRLSHQCFNTWAHALNLLNTFKSLFVNCKTSETNNSFFQDH
jgi:hypothetical protein